MDSTLLRLILIAVGILVLVGIYFWETNRRKQGAAQAKSRETPEINEIPATHESDESAAWEHHDDELDNIEAELAQLSQEVNGSTASHDEKIQLSSETDAPPLPPVENQQEMFGFSAKQESPLDVPGKIIQINLKTKGASFTGQAILSAVKEVGLQPGEMHIYHRYTTDGSHKIVFNMASMVEPGVFPLKSMDDYTTPGLTLFTQLPGPGDSLAIFSDMLFTAERLATMLGGVLQDETHSTLSKQTIETLRSEIVEHRRLVQLARSKR